MRVLVLEGEGGAATDAVTELEANGHAVVRCHEPGAPAFPCAGLAGGGCPLEGDGVDVALTVRSAATGAPSPTEDGIACALRARVPVVVAGAGDANPYAAFGGTTVGATDLAGALAEVVRDARPDLALSGDFIVGFPGEDDDDFRATLKLVDDVRYASAYSFKYSARPGTPAASRIVVVIVPAKASAPLSMSIVTVPAAEVTVTGSSPVKLTDPSLSVFVTLAGAMEYVDSLTGVSR